LALVFAMTIVFCTTISILLPAEGAFAYFGFSADVLDRLPAGAGVYHLAKFEYFRDSPSPLLSFASLQGVVTFPSFHCCLALMTIAATWSMRWLFPMSLAWNALVIASTVPIGGHYAIDILGGAAAWLGANAVAMRLAQPSFEPMDQDRTGPALHESAIGTKRHLGVKPTFDR
jgi:membrane-associated phospholipid phosphatase